MHVRPSLVAVKPRAVCGSSGAIPIVDLLGDVLDSGREATVVLCGEKGWGKSAALSHLAYHFAGRDDLLLVDAEKQSAFSSARVKVFACRNAADALKRNAECWTIAPWGLDEALEYLLCSHRSACESLVPKLHRHASGGLLPQRPVLWRLLLDLMAHDESIATIQDGIDRIIREYVEVPEFRYNIFRRILVPFAKAILLDDNDPRARTVEPLVEEFKSQPEAYKFATRAIQLISEEAIFVPIALSVFISELTHQPRPTFLTKDLLNDRAIELIARRVAYDPSLTQKLTDLIANEPLCQPMAATVLCRALPNWRPSHPLAYLGYGIFDGVNWDGVHVRVASQAKDDLSFSASRASFRGASLKGASFSRCHAIATDFSNANLSGADLRWLGGRDANFSGATLHCTRFQRAMLSRTDFTGADCTAANFEKASLQDADLREACFVSANLEHCNLRGSRMDGANFKRAVFSRAIGTGLDFRQAVLLEATFHGAKLIDCNFEGQSLPMVDFIEANLSGALFSNTVIENGSFFGAKLIQARLGDINWENCDLRNVDLRGALFHYGSTRSGLVGSPYPSHGTRTGFYTDDFYDQPFKSPEEIRKASLRGCDLRGANLSHVDFYLVDLRDTRLDRKQAEHVRKCGAILETRV